MVPEAAAGALAGAFAPTLDFGPADHLGSQSAWPGAARGECRAWAKHRSAHCAPLLGQVRTDGKLSAQQTGKKQNWDLQACLLGLEYTLLAQSPLQLV